MLEECLKENRSLPVDNQQPPTLFSLGEQLPKHDVIERQTTRGVHKRPSTHIISQNDVEEEGSRRKRKK